LTTPTGAAILTTLVNAFGPLPAMTIDRIGYGAGQKDLEEQANLLRLLVGQTSDSSAEEQLWVLETNLDDISGELVGHTIARLWEAGALDVYTTAIQMKKNRPGVTLSALCQADRASALEAIMFRETTTLGIRRWMVHRRKLRREVHRVETPWGPVEGMLAWPDAHSARFSPEFESCRRVAEQHGVPLKAVYEAAQAAYRPKG
jgi:pyridinium-3,5-bisthiocarboxylic acid mononucleotide nickel chelatase